MQEATRDSIANRAIRNYFEPYVKRLIDARNAYEDARKESGSDIKLIEKLATSLQEAERAVLEGAKAGIETIVTHKPKPHNKQRPGQGALSESKHNTSEEKKVTAEGDPFTQLEELYGDAAARPEILSSSKEGSADTAEDDPFA